MDLNRDAVCCEELWQSVTDTEDIALYDSGWVLTPGRDIPIRFCPFCGEVLRSGNFEIALDVALDLMEKNRL